MVYEKKVCSWQYAVGRTLIESLPCVTFFAVFTANCILTTANFPLEVFILKAAVPDIELSLLQPGVTLESVGIKRSLVNDICNAL